jgi:TetR/AcrR family transcriptional regulator
MKDSNTKQRLLAAGLELFTGKGFAGASTREIVERAGVTKPVLYYHFSSKEDLYRVLIEEDFARFNRALEEIAAGPGTPPEKLTRVADYNFEHCRKHPEEVKLTLMAFYRGDTFAPEVDIVSPARSSIEIIAGIFREGISAGTFRKADPMKLSLFLLSALHGQMMVIIKGAKGMPLARPEEIIRVFLEGIAKR